MPAIPGTEVKICWPQKHGPCADRACDEEARKCDCENPDEDGDGAKIEGCAKEGEKWDCDDADKTRSPALTEVCSIDGPEDTDHHDEDCDPETYGSKDADGDGYYDAKCANAHPVTGELSMGSDCDDGDKDIYPGAKELCDLKDNDCNGFRDDVFGIPDGELHKYYPDEDGDYAGSNDPDKELMTLCAHPPPGYVHEAGDCDDGNPNINPFREEICNGLDDDCYRGTDLPRAEGGLLVGDPHNGDGTKFECRGANGWVVVECPPGRLDCGEKSSLDRCETIGTTMTNCGECGRSCTFACGKVNESGLTSYDCDEVVQVAVGAEHACARTSGGRATCWGRGDDGRLGNGTEADFSQPVWVAGLPGVTAIATGKTHTCAIAGETQTPYCWGHNGRGELGDGTKTTQLLPTPVSNPFSGQPLTGATQVATGTAHTCVVHKDGPSVGMVWCWGEPANGRLGNSRVLPGMVAPVLLDGTGVPVLGATRVAAGEAHSCAVLETGVVGCWGSNAGGQIGQAETIAELDGFAVVAGVTGASDVVAGPYHSCALAADKVWCWGDNFFGQLGRRTSTLGYVPETVPGLDDIEAITAGEGFTCALRRSGEVLCWGLNYRGVIGSPSDVDLTPDPRSLGLNDIRQLAAGSGACAVDDRQAAYCWGDNTYGQLANGGADRDHHPVPQVILVPVSGL